MPKNVAPEAMATATLRWGDVIDLVRVDAASVGQRINIARLARERYYSKQKFSDPESTIKRRGGRRQQQRRRR